MICAFLLACGARTDLGARVDVGVSVACSTPAAPAKSCTAWHAGTPRTIAPADSSTNLSGAIASGCGVLVAWCTVSLDSIAWTTGAVDFAGELFASPLAHPAIAGHSSAPGAISLANDGTRIGGLVNDADGCRFVTMDQTGHELEGAIDLGTGRCTALAANGKSWSFLDADGQGNVSLVGLENGTTKKKTLETAAPQVLWDRVVFTDGSFLLDTFLEQANAQYDNTLTPYDTSGNPLGPGNLIGGFVGAPASIARAGSGAMATWSSSTIEALPVDTLGQTAGAAQMVSNASTVYELSIFPVPNGDVLAVWVLLEPTNEMSLYARALAPDGTPRGPERLLSQDVTSAVVYGAVESTGARALLAVTTKDGALEALPLMCVE